MQLCNILHILSVLEHVVVGYWKGDEMGRHTGCAVVSWTVEFTIWQLLWKKADEFL